MEIIFRKCSLVFFVFAFIAMIRAFVFSKEDEPALVAILLTLFAIYAVLLEIAQRLVEKDHQ